MDLGNECYIYEQLLNIFGTDLVIRHVKTSEATSIKVDDVVVIKEDKMSPRSNWRTGRIEELVCGNDEQVRGAEIMTISKTGRQVKISRPVQKPIPLEVVRNETNGNETLHLPKLLRLPI